MPNNALPQYYLNMPRMPENERSPYFAPGAQALSTGSKTPYYFIPPDQYSPMPVRPNPTNNPSIDALNQQEIYQQLIGTSVNVRNKSLQDLLEQMNVPVEQMYAAQAVGQSADQRGQELTSLRSNLAARGLMGSGAENLGIRAANTGYLKNVNAGAAGAKQLSDQRNQQMLQQLLDIPAEDLRFYQAIREGTIPGASLWSNHAQDWGQVAYGLGTAVRSIATYGAGGGAGGGAGALMGGGGGGGFSGMMGGGGGGMRATGVGVGISGQQGNPF